MKMLQMDFERVKTLCDLVVRREGVTSLMVDLTNEHYEQRLHEWLDTSGRPRQTAVLTKAIVQQVLDVPKYFDDGPITLKASKKRKRSSVAGSSLLDIGHPLLAEPSFTAAPAESQLKLDAVIAGHDGGLPAPCFLDPLPSRESYVTSWANEVPFVPYCENGKEVVTASFQHRLVAICVCVGVKGFVTTFIDHNELWIF